MSSNNIEGILQMMDQMLDDAWMIPLSGGKGAIEVDNFRELIEDIRLHLPTEIGKAKEIVNDRKIILDDAKKEAEMVIRVAEERAKQLTDNSELVKQAQQKANEILSVTQTQARDIKKAASDYVDSLLHECESQLSKDLTEIKSKRQALRSTGKNA